MLSAWKRSRFSFVRLIIMTRLASSCEKRPGCSASGKASHCPLGRTRRDKRLSFPPAPRLRLVPREPQPRRRLAVRISVLDGRAASAECRVFHFAHDDELDELIALAKR